ncbi:MAG: acetate--CoA ligase family protein [Syntrophales bacterium]|nr:acetate--CoA ligase family protein [Syntrophales bacterium]
MSDNPLHLLMNPKSIATVGAGNNPLKMGTLQALSILCDGYQGAFYPVHPADKQVLGRKAYPSVADLPEAPDLAMLIVPTDQVAQLLEEFGRIGTKRAIVISAGFKETGADGRDLEQKLNEIAGRYGMRFLGPNCVGMINSQIFLNMTVGRWSDRPGRLGLVSQSGTYITQSLCWLKDKGIRFSKAISVGNEANINLADALEYLGEDEATQAIILYIEGIRNGQRFVDVARRITPHKPILAQYVGGSAAGARAGQSHTGAMAGPDSLYEGIFRQAGVLRVQTLEELYGHGWALATQPPLRGRRLGVMTNSGGPGTAISHTADTGGMEIPRYSEGLQKEIRRHILSHASSANPVDMTFHLDMQLLSTTIPEMILKSGEVDAMIIHGVMNSGFMRDILPHLQHVVPDITMEKIEAMFHPDMSGMVELPAKYRMPLLVSSFFGREDNCTAAYMDHDIPVFDTPEKAARAMLALLRYKGIRERKQGSTSPLPPADAEAKALLAEARGQGRKALDEHQAKRILARYGIPVARESLAQSEDEAIGAARKIGYPVAAKACSWRIPHKSGKGLLALRLTSDDDVRAAFRSIQAAAGSDVAVLIQGMVQGEREVVAGMTRLPSFGPCILFGLGGVFTEALKDNAIRCAPLTDADAEEMIFDIRARDLLGAFRGLPPVDVSSLTGILRKVGEIALLHPEIAEIDLNPIIIDGDQPVAVDALFVLA